MRFSAAALVLFAAFVALFVPSGTRVLASSGIFPTVCTLDALPTPAAKSIAGSNYRGIVINRIAACRDKIAATKDPKFLAREHFCNPRYSWKTLGNFEIYERLYVCARFVSLAEAAETPSPLTPPTVTPSPSPTPTPYPTPTALFHAGEPALYVYTTGTAPSVSGIDNPNTLLIWTVANQIQSDFFPDRKTIVVPEPSWGAADFASQCQSDRYDGTRGTFGGIALSGATATSGGDFYVVISKGWTHADFTAAMLDCTQAQSDRVPLLRGVFNATGQSYRTYVPLQPMAVLATFISALNPNVDTTKGLLGNAAVLGLFSNLTNFNVGTSTPQVASVPRAYVDSARNLSMNLLASFCDNSQKADAFLTPFCHDAPKAPASWRAGWPPAPCLKEGQWVVEHVSCNESPSPVPSAPPHR